MRGRDSTSADTALPATDALGNLAHLAAVISILTIPLRPIISEPTRTDLRQIFRVGRTAAVDDQFEVNFSTA